MMSIRTDLNADDANLMVSALKSESAFKKMIKDYEESTQATEVGRMLGFRRMPEGYALMLNSDETHFYWLRWDGKTSSIHWDMWAVYRGAKQDSKKFTNDHH